MFRKSKPSRKYCMEIPKQIAALKFQKFVLSGKNEFRKCNFDMEKSIFSVNT